MRYAQVIDSVVVNVVLWDGVTEYTVEGDLVYLDDNSPVSIGYLYDGSTFTDPNPIPDA